MTAENHGQAVERFCGLTQASWKDGHCDEPFRLRQDAEPVDD